MGEGDVQLFDDPKLIIQKQKCETSQKWKKGMELKARLKCPSRTR